MAAKRMKKADPNCTIVAPSCATFDMKFYDACFRLGLLEHVDGVSVHPYCDVPEWNLTRYLHLHHLINRYSTRPRRELPIVNTEMGFSEHFQVLGRRTRSRNEQAGLVIRSLLVDQIAGVAMRAIYVNKDYSHDTERLWGLTTADDQPKAAYHAIKTFTKALAGLTFEVMLEAGDTKIFERLADDHVALFSGGDRSVAAAWTSSVAHEALIQIPGKPSAILDMLGNPIPIPSDTGNPSQHLGRKMVVQLSGEPI